MMHMTQGGLGWASIFQSLTIAATSGGAVSSSPFCQTNEISYCSHVVPFSLSLFEERGQVLPNGNCSVDPGGLVDEHL